MNLAPLAETIKVILARPEVQANIVVAEKEIIEVVKGFVLQILSGQSITKLLGMAARLVWMRIKGVFTKKTSRGKTGTPNCAACPLLLQIKAKEGCKMATSNNNIWSTLLKSLMAIGLTYAANKCTNSSTGWVEYRNQLYTTAITTAATALVSSDSSDTSTASTDSSTSATDSSTSTSAS